MKFIKIIGAERSGVGYIAELFRLNALDATIIVDGLGYRYEPPLEIGGIRQFLKVNKFYMSKEINRLVKDLSKGKEKIFIVVVTKNPYSWYKSMRRHRTGNEFNLELEFKRYNEVYKSYQRHFELEENSVYNKIILVRYEDMLDEQSIVNCFNYFRKTHGILFKDKIIPEKVEGSDKFTPDRKDFYLSPGPYKIDPDTINRITLLVDWFTIGKLCLYNPMDPREMYPFGKRTLKQLSAEMQKSGVIKILKEFIPKL